MRMAGLGLVALAGFSGAPVFAQGDDSKQPVERAKFEANLDERFAAHDVNGDGFLTTEDGEKAKKVQKADANGDGKVDKAEFKARMLAHFDRADINKDGVVTPEERAEAHKARQKPAAPTQ